MNAYCLMTLAGVDSVAQSRSEMQENNTNASVAGNYSSTQFESGPEEIPTLPKVRVQGVPKTRTFQNVFSLPIGSPLAGFGRDFGVRKLIPGGTVWAHSRPLGGQKKKNRKQTTCWKSLFVHPPCTVFFGSALGGWCGVTLGVAFRSWWGVSVLGGHFGVTLASLWKRLGDTCGTLSGHVGVFLRSKKTTNTKEFFHIFRKICLGRFGLFLAAPAAQAGPKCSPNT